MYYFGTVAYIAMISLFVYFTYSSYNNAISQAFIALDETSGTCNTVPIAVTGSYLADSEGNWVGSPEFSYSQAKYDIFLSNFEVNGFDQYQEMMDTFYQSLQDIGQTAKQQNLAYNIVYWISFLRYYSVQYPTATNFSDIGYGQLQYIQMTGDPLTTFDLANYQIQFASQSGYCRISNYASYDQANGKILTSYNITSFISDSACSAAAAPEDLGYLPGINDMVFHLSLDIRSIMTALAVNLGVMELSNLGLAGDFYYPIQINNVSYIVAEYFDTRYTAMKPIVCLHNTTKVTSRTGGVTQACFVLIGATLALPTFDHFGLSTNLPDKCICSTNGHKAGCQLFNFLLTLIFFPIGDRGSIYSETLSQIITLVRLMGNFDSYTDLNDAAYDAAWGGASYLYQNQSSKVTSKSWLKQSFDFCSVGTSDCQMIIINPFDAVSQLVSEYKFQLYNGSCSDSFSIPQDEW